MNPNFSRFRLSGCNSFLTVILAVPLVCGLAASALAEMTDSKQWSIAAYDRLLARTRAPNDLVTMGDMVFRASTVRSFREHLAAGGGASTLSATPPAFNRWPKGRVPYVFDGAVSVDHQRDFRQAARDWNTFAHVRFVLRTTESDYLIVQNATGSSESFAVGKIGGAQPFDVASWGRYDLLHGMGHALGLIHEHQRSDRDQFVLIKEENIQPGSEENFVLIPRSMNNGAYDFYSVMHYRRNAYSIAADKDTIRPKSAYQAFLKVYGQQHLRPLSRGDRDGMASLYGVGRESGPIVVNGRGAGPGSLQAALYFGFDHPGTTILFNIPASDPSFDGNVFRIKPRGTLFAPGPDTIIDATSQPMDPKSDPDGPAVFVDGQNASAAGVNGIDLMESNCEIRGLGIINFTGDGIRIHGANTTGNRVVGCSVGIGPSASSGGNVGVGIHLFNHAHDNTLGGSGAEEGNEIGDNGQEGVLITGPGAAHNVLQGNQIGANQGTFVRANGRSGVALVGGVSQTMIGGEEPGAGNLISGNVLDGITLDGRATTYNEILGNFIGSNADGSFGIANRGAGVALTSGAHLNTIGRPGAGNTIFFNQGAGVTVAGNKTTGNLISGNNIGRNGTSAIDRLGIDLVGGSEASGGVTANDTRDPDKGPNKLQNYPVLTGANITDAGITITGSLNSMPNESIRLEFFSSVIRDLPTGFGEGERFLSFADVVTDANGDVNFSADLPATVGQCSFISATATSGSAPSGSSTDPGFNTSEFSRSLTAIPCP